MTTYAVTGATGGLGAAAVAALRTKGVPASDIVAVVRDAAKTESLAADGVVVRVAPYEDPGRPGGRTDRCGPPAPRRRPPSANAPHSTPT